MISDESSSDSETGRFKSGSTQERGKNESNDDRKRLESRSFGRGRQADDRTRRRDFENRRDDRDHRDRRSRDRSDRHRYSRTSPTRHRSRERSSGKSNRRSRERREKSKDLSSNRRSRERHSKSKEMRRSPHRKNLTSPVRRTFHREEITKHARVRSKSRDKTSSSPSYGGKRSIIHKPTPTATAPKRKVESPIDIVQNVSEDEVQVEPGSYYSMVPAVVKEKDKPVEKVTTLESSEIDSSDDERLRAKLLNLEKELQQTRKKKHKKKHKKKSSKSHKEREDDSGTAVEVSSTTDILEKSKQTADADVIEVSSTQKEARGQKNCSEEGEILSDDVSLSSLEIDSNDLRHRIKRTQKADTEGSPDLREVLKSKSVEVCGPALPPHLEKRGKDKSAQAEGPALPPHLQKKGRTLGPSIPSDMRAALSQRDVTYESSDDDAIGPLPAGAEKKWTDAHKHLEERAMGMKIKKLEGDKSKHSDIKTREQWMLELPEGKAKILGLEARSFRAKEGPDMSDRSSWTDTPEEKARKAAGLSGGQEPSADALRREAETRIIEIRDDEQEKAVKKHKKKHKRDESLLELHEKKIKKKKKKEDKEEKQERRPFSRDTDLQVNRFDEAQKRSIIKKAQQLDTRFSRGEAKYL